MIENDEGVKQKYLLRLVVLLCLICLCLSCSTGVAPPETDTNTASDPNAVTAEQRAQDAALRSATKSVTMSSSPSLEMKENADFLLTPALLVQEAISDDIIITYPSE